MPDLISQMLDVGRDAYGRRVTMTRSKTYDGKIVWTIVSDPSSQRDEGETMRGLSDDNIRQMAQALDAISAPVRHDQSRPGSPAMKGEELVQRLRDVPVLHSVKDGKTNLDGIGEFLAANYEIRMEAATALERKTEGEPYCYVHESPGFFDPNTGGEPPSTDFSFEPRPGYVPLYRA